MLENGKMVDETDKELTFTKELFPKAIKGWNVAWGKGFTRIYYVLAFIVTLVLAGTESDFKFAEFMFKYMKK